MNVLGHWFAGMAVLFVAGACPAAQSELVAIKLNTLWRIKQAEGFQITASPPEKNTKAVIDALYYVPSSPNDLSGTPVPGLSPLYQLVHKAASRVDTMPSSLQTEGGYVSIGVLGYAWDRPDDANTGTVPIVRAFANGGARSLAGMHTLLAPKEQLAGYSIDGNLAFAYPRARTAETLESVSGGGVTVKSNADAGGSVWEWWWRGKQFINDYDYGRQLSMAVYTDDGKALQETGDHFGTPEVPLYARHPSPTDYIKSSTGHESSRAIPVEWFPEHFTGGNNNAVIYANAKIGKELSLNWQGPDDQHRNWPVAMYESVYEGPPLSVATIEAPTAYLTAEFTTYYKYDPKTDSLTLISVNHNKVNVSGGSASGVIIASGAGPSAVAMGIYINDPNAGIAVYDNAGPSVGKYGSSFSKWGVIYRSGVQSSWRFRTWIATDSVHNIQQYFHQLYLWNVGSR